MKISIEYKVALGFLLAFTLVLIVVISTCMDMNMVVEMNGRQKQSQFVVKSINETRTALLKVESSSRGYALTGDSVHLKKFDAAVEDAKAQWYNLNDLFKDDTFYVKTKQSLDELIRERITLSTSLINARVNTDAFAKLVLTKKGKGTQLMELINLVLDALENHERYIVDTAVNGGIDAINRTVRMFFLLIILLLIILSFVFILFKKDLTFRREAKRKIDEQNENLEIKVNERTIALAHSEMRYRFLAENAADVVSLHDIDAKYIYVSESVKRIIGFDPIEIIGNCAFDYIHPEDVDFVKERYSDVAKQTSARFSQFRHITKSGNYIWLESVASFTYDENGEVYGLIINTRDISERKKNENELIESRARMNAVLENSSDSIWSIDTKFNLISFNNSYFESTQLFFGIVPYIGMSILGHLSETKQMWSDLYKRALNGEHFSEETVDDTLGIQLFFDVSFNPIIINGEVTGVAVFARDISSRKGFENQLNYKVKELNTFMYKATHDLRSPLVSVMGLVQLAKDQTNDEELVKYFDMINISVHKMDNLLIDLVKIVNVAQGKLVVKVVDFDEMIDDILASLAHRPEFSEITFKKQVHQSAVFSTDSQLLYSIMQNLIDNAIKYKKTHVAYEPLIIITVEANDNQARIGITDNGIGMQDEIQDKVFDMFYRGTTASSGTGLGLYIVKTSIEKLSGKITLNSIYEKGTSINIILPSL